MEVRYLRIIISGIWNKALSVPRRWMLLGHYSLGAASSSTILSCFCSKNSSTAKNTIYTIKNHNNISEANFERFQSPYSSSPSCPAFFSCNNGPSCFLPLGFSSYLPEFDPFKDNSRNFRTSITAPKCGGFAYAFSSACTGLGLTTAEGAKNLRHRSQSTPTRFFTWWRKRYYWQSIL
jgi:hypothetical protein